MDVFSDRGSTPLVSTTGELYEHPRGVYTNDLGEAVVFLTADGFVLLCPLEISG